MAIETRHISKTFGPWKALRDVSLLVNQGELVALLGPSGSGKTTLLRIIAGLESPDPTPETAVLIDGEDTSRQPVDQRRVGFVFQHYALFRHMTVFENIAFGLRVRPRKERPGEAGIRWKVGRLLELIQLDRWANQYPSQLSGGQRQRVALARALAIEPRVLLLDEPFGALDARVRQELRRWLRRLHDEIHVTSVLVTHDQEEALEVSDRVVVMNEGRVEQYGPPEEVFHRPATEFVMNFLGSVNLFHARLETDPGVSRVFVRPHELDIERSPTGAFVLPASVTRIQSTGPLVKVRLNTAEGEEVNVELTHERYRELQLNSGDCVFVKVRGGRVFTEDAAVDLSPDELSQAARTSV